jgi:formylglycine-generating enzyme required for sulfatase activity
LKPVFANAFKAHANSMMRRCLLAYLVLFGATTLGMSPSTEFREPTTGMEFVAIPIGNFMMGSPVTEPDRGQDEVQHRVTLTHQIYMGKFEVTQKQWETVMGSNPSDHKKCGPDCPVENVTWYDVQNFLRRLTEVSPHSRFRLPTEAEWEYACRAGTTTAYSTGASLTVKQACFDSKNGPKAVGSYAPNSFGLFDMHGNVWEWCEDWYGPYQQGDAVDPRGPSSGSKRVIRGGSWYFGADSARSALRYTHSPGDRGFSLGFRTVRETK